jgi:uncharacterized protein YjbI with pentapeptide repeats
MRGVILREADLSQANLAEADLGRADLQEANLCGANLSQAILRGAGLRDARYDQQTQWPEGLMPAIAGAILVASKSK